MKIRVNSKILLFVAVLGMGILGVLALNPEPVKAGTSCNSGFIGLEDLDISELPPQAAELVSALENSTSEGVQGSASGQGEVKGLVSVPIPYCGGIPLSTGEFVCNNADQRINVTDNSAIYSGRITFNKNCKVNVVLATIPAELAGISNLDGFPFDYSIELGEVPDGAHSIGYTLQATAKYDENAESSVGSTIAYSGWQYQAPGDEKPEFASTGQPSTLLEYIVRITGGGTGIQEGDSLSPGTTQHTGTNACDISPLSSSTTGFRAGCESYILAGAYAAMGIEATKTPAGGEGHLLVRPSVQTMAETEEEKEEARTCYAHVEGVPFKVSCVDIATFFKAWRINMKGFLSDLSCIEEDNCYHNVQLVLDTAKILGDNAGCNSAFGVCPDMYPDFLNATLRAPGHTQMTAGMIEDHDFPYYEDRKIGTPAIVEVCGKYTTATLIWEDYAYAYHSWVTAQRPPCDPETDKGCSYESYREAVNKNLGGITGL